MCEGGAELNSDCLSIREFLHEERTCAWSVHLYVPNAKAIPGTPSVFHKAFVQWKGNRVCQKLVDKAIQGSGVRSRVQRESINENHRQGKKRLPP